MRLVNLFPLTLSVPTLAFNLVREYSGSTFFDRWNYYGKFDNLTNGDVIFVNQSQALSSNLVSVDPVTQNAILRVDNGSNVAVEDKRNSVRLDSMDTYGFGSLWVIDVVHLPFGCAVWPAFWTRGENWPTHGEIDIIEGVNLVTQNQMGLHTLPGCMQTTGSDQLGTSGSDPDCNQGNASEGCSVKDTTSMPSYGQAFNNEGGGVWATQFDVSGVFIWFWDRATVPAELQKNASAQTLDISTWGNPVASFVSTACNMSEFFGDQTLVLDITLCGDDAGNINVYPQTCANEPPNIPNPPTPPAGVSACYFNNVPGPGSPRFDDAFFEISYIRAYSTGVPSASATGSSSTGASSGTGVPAIGNGPSAAAAASLAASSGAVIIAATVGVLGAFIGAVLVQ